jgi:hypothetical protein
MRFLVVVLVEGCSNAITVPIIKPLCLTDVSSCQF